MTVSEVSVHRAGGLWPSYTPLDTKLFGYKKEERGATGEAAFVTLYDIRILDITSHDVTRERDMPE
jgi:hypothetical protein